MLAILAERTYRHLFAAQVVSLLGTGLATVALGLLAHDLAGPNAGAVLGTALFLKMVAYVGLAPVAGALAERLPRRAVLVGLDLVRAGVALMLPFVDAVWQVYVLILVLQSASAAFTPTFQATIPDVLPDEADYTRALSLSRLAYDLETLASPALAAAALTLVSFDALFAGTAIGFLASAALVASVVLPSPRAVARPFRERLTRGLRLHAATPRLRGALALFVAVAAAGAMVIVNTVVVVKETFGLGSTAMALALAVNGAGSMAATLALPRLLERLPDRPVMSLGATLLVLAMLVGPFATGLATLAPVWLVAGLGGALVQTPVGRLLRRSSQAADRPALFAAQFALGHACWLVTYPLAGQLGARVGLDAAFLVLGALALAGLIAGRALWPADAEEAVLHVHPDLPADHPHLAEPAADRARRHAHAFVADELHHGWPR